MARPKNESAITKSRAMNQFCCQNGNSRRFLGGASLFGADADVEDEVEVEVVEKGLLRETNCSPEEATVYALREKSLNIREKTKLRRSALGFLTISSSG